MNIENLRRRILKLSEARAVGTIVIIITVNENGTVLFNVDGHKEYKYTNWYKAADKLAEIKSRYSGDIVIINDSMALRATDAKKAQQWKEFADKNMK